MYLRKEKKTVETGTIIVVPFCDDCGSQEVKAVYTCQNCKSHNIKFPNIIDKDDERGLKKETREIDIYKYKCDICGNEYEWTKKERPNTIHCEEDNFNTGPIFSDYSDGFNYTFKEDVCPDCLDKIISKLNKELNSIFDSKHIEAVKNEFKLSDTNKDIDIINLDVYDFEEVTMAAPTQFMFFDESRNEYFFRYRFGKWQLYKTTLDKDRVILKEGLYGDSLDGYISKENFLKLMLDNGIKINIKSHTN